MYSFELLGKTKLKERKSWSINCSDEHELDDCLVDDNVKKILINNIRRRLTPQAVKCRAGKSESLPLPLHLIPLVIIYRC